MFLSIFKEIAKQYPTIQSEDYIVDNACMQMVMHPEKFDVMVMPNLYGDILSDLASGLIGGLGFLPSANLGEKMAMFEAVHGSAPDIANQNLANPTALLLSACMMLDYLQEEKTATCIRTALFTVLEEGKIRTQDCGGQAKTDEFADEIISKIII